MGLSFIAEVLQSVTLIDLKFCQNGKDGDRSAQNLEEVLLLTSQETESFYYFVRQLKGRQNRRNSLASFGIL